MQHLARAAFSNAYLLLTLTTLFWAGNLVLGRGVHGHVPPIALGCVRWWIAFAVVLPFAWPYLRRDWAVIRANIPMLIFLGIFGVSCFSAFLYIGLNYTTAINGLVVQSSGPVVIALVCFLTFGDRLRPVQAFGVALSLAGVLITVMRGDPAALAALQFNVGDLWILLAVVTWAIYTAYLRNRPDIHWLSFAAISFLVGAMATTPFFVAEHLSGWRLQADLTTGLAIAYTALFPSILSYVFYNRSVELIGGARAGAFLHLVPPFGAALAIGLLGEALRAYHLVGFAVILLGVTLAARSGPAPARTL